MNWIKIISERFTESSKEQSWFTGLFSIIGMGIGCFAMVIALSVMNGFELLVHDKLKGFEGDLRIIKPKIEPDIQSIEGIKATMPFIERRGLIEVGNDQKVVSLKAVDVNKMKSFYTLQLKGNIPKLGQVVIGQNIANRLGKNIGDEILIYSPIDQSFGYGLPLKKKMTISGIFSTKILDYDDRFVFMSLIDGKRLFKRKSGIDGIDIRFSQGADKSNIEASLNELFGHKIQFQSWDNLNKALIDAMKMERLGTILILSLIFLVAAFNLAASLALTSIQKMKEVGILKAMGASEKSIKTIIIRIGLKIAGKGALWGISMGFLLVEIQNWLGIIPLPSDVYFIDALPMTIFPVDIIVVAGISFLFILMASYISGRKLAETKIIEVLQWSK